MYFEKRTPIIITDKREDEFAITTINLINFQLTIFIFNFPRAGTLLANTHKNAVANLFTLVRFAIQSDPRCIDDFEDCTVKVRRALASTSASFEFYAQWRRWTHRTVRMDYDSLSQATRPLFYCSYSLFWTLVMAPVGNGSGGVFLFCDNAIMYDMYFRMPRMAIEGAMMAIQESLCRILVHDPVDECHAHQHMEMIISRHLWHGCMRNIHILKETYLEHRNKCFSTSGQHWSFIEYLHQVISLTMSVCGYVHVIAEIFLPDVALDVYPILEDVCENLANIRNEGSLRIDHFQNPNEKINPTREFFQRSASCSNHNDDLTYQNSSQYNIGKYSLSAVPRGVAHIDSFSDDDDDGQRSNKSLTEHSHAAEYVEGEFATQDHYPGTINRYTFARFQRSSSQMGSGAHSATQTLTKSPR